VAPASARSFDDIVATYGDPDFTVPRPTGVADDVSITYTIEASTVAEIVDDNRIQINGAGNTTITAHWQVGGGEESQTGNLTVNKAQPRLVFSFPKRLYKTSVCGSVWKWPVANQGTDNTVGGILTTNSDGALYYPMGTVPGRGSDNGPSDPYYDRWMGTKSYTPEMAETAGWEPAWVEQAESANFLAARSETLYYATWGNDRVIWSETLQRWVTSCGG
jgi:hypothetical protein